MNKLLNEVEQLLYTKENIASKEKTQTGAQLTFQVKMGSDKCETVNEGDEILRHNN